MDKKDLEKNLDAVTSRALERMVELMGSSNERVALKAAEAILNRKFGRAYTQNAPQPVPENYDLLQKFMERNLKPQQETVQ